jgi:hypothetical protein
VPTKSSVKCEVITEVWRKFNISDRNLYSSTNIRESVELVVRDMRIT